MSNQAELGKQSMLAKDYKTAANHYTDALKTNPSNPNPQWLIERSSCYHRLGEFESSLADAESAIHAGKHRQKREAIAAGQFRRAVALHGLKRYGDSRLCFTWAQKLNPKEKMLLNWMAIVKKAYEEAEKVDPNSEAVRTIIKESPEKVEPTKVEPQKDEEKTVDEKAKDKTAVTPESSSVKPIAQSTPKDKIRSEFFQNPNTVTITIFAKGVPKDGAEVSILEDSLEVRFPTSASDTYDYTVSPLFQKIDPSSSSFRITPHKIEITLKKAQAGIKWAGPEGTETSNALLERAGSTTPAVAATAHKQDKAPAYPTSSKSGPKDWEHLGADADAEDGNEMDSFFKKLYKDADPDTRRAMIKSYQESNGTALSTNWADVGSKRVEISPPDGVEAKKWNE